MTAAQFIEWLRYQTVGPEPALIGTPPARLTVLTSSGRKALTTKRARTVSPVGRRLAGDASSHEHDTE